MPAQGGAVQSNPVTSAVADIVGQQAASIVSQAASILDEEMARGVLAARRSAATRSARTLGREQPVAAAGARARRQRRGYLAEPAECPGPAARRVQPAVERGGPAGRVEATSNREARSARHHLDDAVQQREPFGAPGSRRRPICSAVEAAGLRARFSSSRLRNSAWNRRSRGTWRSPPIVPDDAAPGCYSGLLVVRGVDYLRALITIEVE